MDESRKSKWLFSNSGDNMLQKAKNIYISLYAVLDFSGVFGVAVSNKDQCGEKASLKKNVLWCKRTNTSDF